MIFSVLHGPNLNLLGTHHQESYGALTLSELNGQLQTEAARLGCQLQISQSNVEGELVSSIQRAARETQGLLLNAGAYTHTSVAIRDAIWATGIPTVEVHLTNIYAREEFRRKSLLAEVCVGSVLGFGPQSYLLGLQGLASFLQKSAR